MPVRRNVYLILPARHACVACFSNIACVACLCGNVYLILPACEAVPVLCGLPVWLNVYLIACEALRPACEACLCGVLLNCLCGLPVWLNVYLILPCACEACLCGVMFIACVACLCGEMFI